MCFWNVWVVDEFWGMLSNGEGVLQAAFYCIMFSSSSILGKPFKSELFSCDSLSTSLKAKLGMRIPLLLWALGELKGNAKRPPFSSSMSCGVLSFLVTGLEK